MSAVRWSCGLLAALLVLVFAKRAGAELIELSTGEILHAVVLHQDDQTVTIRHPALGELVLQREHLRAIHPDPARTTLETLAGTPEPTTTTVAADTVGSTAVAAAPVEQMPRSYQNFFEGWKSTIDLSFSGTEGNSNTTSFRAAFKTIREDDYDRWIVDAAYYFTKNGGATSRNEGTFGVNKDWLNPASPWFWFAQGRFDYDEFKPWQSRGSLFGGAGYTFVKNPKLEFIGRLGAGVTKEFGGEESIRAEGLVGMALMRYQINSAQNIAGSATLYPDITHPGLYRIVSAVEWTIKIDQLSGIALKIGLENEYESEVPTGSAHNDLKYYGGLQFSF